MKTLNLKALSAEAVATVSKVVAARQPVQADGFWAYRSRPRQEESSRRYSNPKWVVKS